MTSSQPKSYIPQKMQCLYSVSALQAHVLYATVGNGNVKGFVILKKHRL